MEIVTKIAPIILGLIMFGLGLGLKIEDFTRVLKTPRDFIVGFISQLVILPFIAYLLIIIFKTTPEIAVAAKTCPNTSAVPSSCTQPKTIEGRVPRLNSMSKRPTIRMHSPIFIR